MTSLTFRQTKIQLDKIQIQSKKLITKKLQIKINQKSQILKIYSYYRFSLSLLLSASLILSPLILRLNPSVAGSGFLRSDHV